jgi:hypothetical protein
VDGREGDRRKRGADRAGLWFASPFLLALVGLVGTGLGADFQGTRVREKFALIQNVLDTADKTKPAEILFS